LLVAGAASGVVPNGLLVDAKEAPNEGEAGDGCGEPTLRLLFAVMILVKIRSASIQPRSWCIVCKAKQRQEPELDPLLL